jgi:peptidyl-prolyl cis-trans isomerase C
MKARLPVVALGCLVLTLGACSDGDKIAEVAGRTVTQQEFNSYLKFKRIPQQDETRTGKVLEDYLQREALAAAVQDSQFIDADQLDTEINEFRKQLLISRYFENYLQDVVSDEAIRNFYNTNKEEFQEERTKVAHLLIRTNDKMSEQERRALLTKAQEAYSKANSGTPFEEVVKQYSEDTISAGKGGEIGWIQRGAIDPVFSDRAFSLTAGKISEPFATPFGFHVLKVLDGPQTVEAPFEQVKGNIRYQLRQEAKQAEMERLLASAKVERK